MAVETNGSGNAAEYLDVLLLCAAPLDVRPALNLAVEVANFEAEVRRSLIPIRLRRVFPPTFGQLQRELSPPALLQHAPRVFHFLGHGDEDYLWFEDDEGSGDKVTQGRPVVLGVRTFSNWDIPSAADTGEINLPLPLSQPDGGHAICLVGYELRPNAPGGGVFLFRNSWGKSWAAQSRYKAGYGTLFFEYVRQHAVEAYR